MSSRSVGEIGQPISDESSNILGTKGSRVDIAIDREHPIHRRIVKTDKHDSIILLGLDDVSNGAPFQATPLFLRILRAKEDDDQLTSVPINVLQERVEVRSGEL